MKKIIGLDTETTGLLQPINAPIGEQPYITEVCFLIFDMKMNLIDEFETLIKPPVEIPFYIEKKTKIENWMVKNEKPFKKYTKKIREIVNDSCLIFGQNINFDIEMMNIEFERTKGKPLNWPKSFCTIENSMHLRGRRLKNDELYYILTGKQLLNNHRAKPDITATAGVFKILRGIG